MSAARMWVRADLRRRWRSWVVLGILAGITAGIAAAAVAGARRTDTALAHYVRVAQVPDAAVLANDPEYDEAKQAAVAALPEVERVIPFAVPFALTVKDPAGIESGLLPIEPSTMPMMAGPLVAGRLPDPARADELVVNEHFASRGRLRVGSTVVLAQAAGGPFDAQPFEQALRVVGISHAPFEEDDSMPSTGFYGKYRDRLLHITNQFVDLKRDETDVAGFRAGVERAVGRPVNVESARDIFGLRQIANVANVEQGGLLLFALAVALGGGVLIGQSLVRSVTAGAADLATWRAIGADSRIAVRALVLPALLSAVVGAGCAIAVATALSPRFPIGHTRRFDLDIGVHADWPVLVLAAAGLLIAMMATALVTAELRVRRGEAQATRPSATARVATAVEMPAPLAFGTRLAAEPGRGYRAVPIRSAFIGAVAGVLGVTACLTFRSGLDNAAADPSRSGVVWDFTVAADGIVASNDLAAIEKDPAVAQAVDARWARAVTINEANAPVFGTTPVKGVLDFIVLDGRAPRGLDELALAPTTMRELDLHVGDEVKVGASEQMMRVVGSVLLPATSHTEYDQSGWMTSEALQRVLPPASDLPDFFYEDHVLIRWSPGADVSEAQARFARLNDGEYYLLPAERPDAVVALGGQRSLPGALAIFFGLLAAATVAHAIVTTVRRRHHDLAVLRALGFTRTNSRVAIAWQATLLAIGGLVIGIPLGIVVGRAVWKQLAESFPVVYVPPLALLAILLIAPAAIAIANLLAAGPAALATRHHPARTLRTE